MMINKEPYISVVIPAYNEAKTIAATLVDVDRYLSKLEHSYEILVINDGSIDKTSDVLKRCIGLISKLNVLEHEFNQGKGAAVRTGMLEAKGEYRLFMDADHAVSIDHLDQIIPILGEVDLIIGSRGIRGSTIIKPQPFIKKTAGWLGSLYIRLFMRMGVKDSQCGFKVFTKDSANSLFNMQRISGWAFDIEIVSLANKLGHRIKEVPIKWVDGPDSRTGFKAYIEVLRDIFKIRWWLWRDSHKK